MEEIGCQTAIRRSLCPNVADFFELKQLKVPLGDIARLMGRHRSTIYREIKRNSFHDTEIPDYNGCHSVVADNISKERRTRLRKLRRHPGLRDLVIE